MPRKDLRVLIDTRQADRPLVSLVVPVYDVAPYVGDCLGSIQANAHGIPLELIVIDDGSRDDSAVVVRDLLDAGEWPEALFVQQENRGLSATRNLGIELARSEYLGFLDSDDLMLPGGLAPLLDCAARTGCDLVMGRSRIFDSVTGNQRPFYDDALWTKLLAGRRERIVQGRHRPQVLSLEPNANYRLIRRRLLLEHGIRFPEGLWFEDAPFHFRTTILARRIGLCDVPYYGYRVNRPGKITDQRGPRRFDVLRVAEIAFTDLLALKATPEEGGAALRVLFRLLWTCGRMSPAHERQRFFEAACRLIGTRCPRPWVEGYLDQQRGDRKHFLLGALLAEGEAGLLTAISSGKRPILPMAGFLLKNGYISGLLR